MIDPERLHQIAKECAELTAKKNKAYGNSFAESGEILKILMPNGCPKEKFQDMLTVARIIDKLFRICTYKDAFNEDPWRDILGYALLMCASQGESPAAIMRRLESGFEICGCQHRITEHTTTGCCTAVQDGKPCLCPMYRPMGKGSEA